MEAILVERNNDPPREVADLVAAMQQASWCMEQYRVQHVISALALDGRQCVCQFYAPDAEALRNVMRHVPAPYERLWSSTVHAPSSPAATAPLELRNTLVVVERCFDQAAEFAALQAIEDRSRWCLDQYRVRFLRTYFSTDRRRMICLYDAPDAEAVRTAQLQAGMPLSRAWPAFLYQP